MTTLTINRALPATHRSLWRVVVPLVTGSAIALTPVPQGLSVNAWRYFAVFAAVIAGIITEPIQPAVLGLAGVVLAAVLGLIRSTPADSASWALSGFANSTVWLIFAAYMFTLGYAKTGLGRRLALLLIRAMGQRTLGLGYAITLADLALAPFTASTTARSGGTIYPIIRNIPELYGSRPYDQSARKIGAYLMYTAASTTLVTSSMFITALAPNALVVSFVARSLNLTISWMDWFKGFLPIGVILLLIVPALLYAIYPPTLKEAPEAPRWAAEELRVMGRITRQEVTLLVLILGALTLWIGATDYVDPTVAAIVVVVLMVLLGVVSWEDVIGHGQAWNVLIWFATLVTLASGLAEIKFVDWLAQSILPNLSDVGVYATVIWLVGSFYVLHYFFASITAHAATLFPVFLAIAVKVPGLSPMAWALLLGYSLGLMGILTPYGGAHLAVYYGSGYIRGRDFWALGLVLGAVFFGVYIAIVLPWLRFLGV